MSTEDDPQTTWRRPKDLSGIPFKHFVIGSECQRTRSQLRWKSDKRVWLHKGRYRNLRFAKSLSHRVRSKSCESMSDAEDGSILTISLYFC